MTFVEKLEKLNGVMPQSTIAEKINTTQSFVSQIMTGKRKRVDFEVGTKINALYAEHFGVDQHLFAQRAQQVV